MMLRVLCVFGILGAFACSGDDGQGPGMYVRTNPLDASSGSSCVDDDGDGYGPGCAYGRDCDDDDPDTTDLCYRCREDADPVEACPCEPGTPDVYCNPNEVADQSETRDGVSGVLKCSEGARFCRDELWTECIGVEFVFVPN